MTRRSKLTPAQIAQAMGLRVRHNWSWDRIGSEFACDGETVHRAVDPEYSHHRYALTVSARINRNEDYATRYDRRLRENREREDDRRQASRVENIIEQDAQFQAAMRAAILRKEEFCIEGVCTAPSTERPVFVFMPGQPFSGTRSAAALCAEVA